MKMLRITLLLLCSLLPALAYAQDDAGTKPLMFGSPLHADTTPLIPAAEKLKEAYTMMKKHPGDSLYEVQYLLAFPHDYQTFEKVFDAENEESQLYSVELNYIYYAMPELSKRHPELVGIDLMELGAQSNFAYPDIEEIAGSLQYTIVKYGVDHTRLFIQLFDQFSEAQKKRLVTMLANVEAFDNGKTYPYETLIKKLESAGAKGIAARLKQAKIARMKIHD